jgi:hypothetical protein
MIRNFKFFSDNDDDDHLIEPLGEEFFLDEDLDIEVMDNDSPSWSWTSMLPLDGYTYDIVETQSNGIREFLNRFPNRFCVPVLSITGPNGRLHDANTEYDDGWGFDITSDLLTIKFLRFED